MKRGLLETGLFMIVTFLSYCKGKTIYVINVRKYKKLNTFSNFNIERKYKYPIYKDRFAEAGTMGTYFWQDLWAARLIAKNMPKEHYDIGSRIDGFIAHLAAFRSNIKVFDIRPLKSVIPGVEFVQADATHLNNIEDNSVESISALCSLEHFGLGRYGDEINPKACFSAMKAIQRVLKGGGHAYISVPIGREHLEFDAHRVFYASTIVETFNELELVEFSCIDYMDKEIEKSVSLHKYDEDTRKGCVRFGLFHFIKEFREN